MLSRTPLSPEDANPTSTFAVADARALLEAGHLKTQKNPKLFTIPFTVLELKTKEVEEKDLLPGDVFEDLGAIQRWVRMSWRRRPIDWPKAMNDRKCALPNIDLPTVESLMNDLKPDSWFRSFDLASSFFQIPLSPEVSEYFSLKDIEGNIYSYTVMPMGFFAACEVMQSILLAVATLALKNRPQVSAVIYIDNVRFRSASLQDLNAVAERFKSLCQNLKITLNSESSNLPHREHDFCGIHYRVTESEAFVKLPLAQISKLNNDLSDLWVSPLITPRRFQEIIARFLWASRILRLDLAFAYHALKFIRHLAHEIALGRLERDTPIPIWPSICPILRSWGDILLKNEEVPIVTNANPAFLLATDASKTGFGAILIDRLTGEVRSFGGSWTPLMKARHINELELMAVTLALEHFGPDLSPASVSVYIDNEAARCSLIKGSSRSYHLNQRLLETLPSARLILESATRIASADNPSDEPSRGLSINLNKVKQWMGNAISSKVPTASPMSGKVAYFPELRLVSEHSALLSNMHVPKAPSHRFSNPTRHLVV
jgi:hypothetical protein